MNRRKIALGAGVALVVAGVAVGYVRWSDSDSCTDAVPEADLEEIEDRPIRFDSPDDLWSGLEVDLIEDDWSEELRDSEKRRADTLLDPGGPLGDPVLAVVDGPHPDLLPGGDIMLAHGGSFGSGFTVSVHDGRDGSLLWAREQQGTSAGGGPVGEGFVLLQTAYDRPLSVAVVDPADGEVRSCVRLGTADGGVPSHGSRDPQPSLALGDTVVVSQPGDREPEQRPKLYRVDLGLDVADDERLRWEQEVDEVDLVAELRGVDAVMVAAGVEHDSSERFRALSLLGEEMVTRLREAGALQVHAFDPEDGEGLWSYPEEVGAEGPVVLHTVVGVTDDVVVVTADQVHEEDGEEEMATTLIGLEPRTGEELWSVETALPGLRTFPDVELFGDVILVRDEHHGDDDNDGRYSDLVGIDPPTGEELWRIPDRTSGLEHGVALDDLLLIPGLNLQGLEVIEAATGESSTALDGLNVYDLVTEDGRIGFRTTIGSSDVYMVYDVG